MGGAFSEMTHNINHYPNNVVKQTWDSGFHENEIKYLFPKLQNKCLFTVHQVLRKFIHFGATFPVQLEIINKL